LNYLKHEKRMYERFASPCPIKFKYSRHDYNQDVSLENVSADGIKIATNEHLYRNDSISLEVLMDGKKHPLMLDGLVVWTKNKSPNLWDVGLKFYQINLMKIQQLVNSSPKE